jgi:hypothetical protein
VQSVVKTPTNHHCNFGVRVESKKSETLNAAPLE